jgi:hypothetical protein
VFAVMQHRAAEDVRMLTIERKLTYTLPNGLYWC